MYQALYRKWRPKTFSDVVGQEHITQTSAKAGGGGADLSRLPLHRHSGHRKDHLRQDPGQGRQL